MPLADLSHDVVGEFGGARAVAGDADLPELALPVLTFTLGQVGERVPVEAAMAPQPKLGA